MALTWILVRRTHVIALLLIAMITSQARADDGVPPAGQQQRQRIGVAFGGGSARGLAHVGVVRWLEEHRIPIDLIAGTSMGGLIGGAVAAGMSSGELAALLRDVNWDEMFGFSPFQYKNIRRKDDARDYPSRIELGVKGGIALPIALNNGQQVDFFLARIAGPYGTLSSFDELPTPFRAIAVDLVAAQEVVLESGSLASALRATMSLPVVFPPVERDGRVLVDGGAMNNVPADVVRGMGADVVIAINVGYMGDTRTVSRSLLGLMNQTVDVMMQATTRTSMKSADVVINPPLNGFASLDWRRSVELEEEGYKAAEAMKDQLLRYAVDEGQWAAYLESRRLAQEDRMAGAAVCVGCRRGAVRPRTHRGGPCSSRRTEDPRRADPRDHARDVCGAGSLRDRGVATRSERRPPRAPDRGSPEVSRAAVPDAGHQPSEHDNR